MDISKCFRDFLGIRDNESRLYVKMSSAEIFKSMCNVTLVCMPIVLKAFTDTIHISTDWMHVSWYHLAAAAAAAADERSRSQTKKLC